MQYSPMTHKAPRKTLASLISENDSNNLWVMDCRRAGNFSTTSLIEQTNQKKKIRNINFKKKFEFFESNLLDKDHNISG